jgi:uncharacterized protein YjbJ (UPF0337 family)
MSVLNDLFNGNWNQINSKLKEEYGEFTEDDSLHNGIMEYPLLGKIPEKIGKIKQESKDWIDSF